MMEIAVSFTYKLKSIVSASSISSLHYYAVLLVFCFLIDLVVLELKKGQGLVLVVSLALALAYIKSFTCSCLVIEIIPII
jgi:hypothetical protein